jgi:hypothetical protein
MGVYEPVKWNKTLTEKEYCKLGELAVNEIKMLTDSDKWRQTTIHQDSSDEEDEALEGDDDNGNVTFYKCKSNLNVRQRVYMARTIMNDVPEKFVRLLLPWKRFRASWDKEIEDLTIIAKYPNNVYLVRELCKSELSHSQFESINVWKLHYHESGIYIGVCGTSHALYPPSKSMKRTHYYLHGYSFIELPGEITQVSIISHVNYNTLTSVDRYVPAILQKHLKEFQIGSRTFNKKRKYGEDDDY